MKMTLSGIGKLISAGKKNTRPPPKISADIEPVELLEFFEMFLDTPLGEAIDWQQMWGPIYVLDPT